MHNAPLITGMGVTSAIGHGCSAFGAALLEGRSAFGFMQRPGRQKDTQFIGAEMPALDAPLSARDLRSTSLSAQAVLVAVREAWNDACLDRLDPSRVGLIVGGSNCQQREQTLLHDAYADRVAFVRPTYGMTFMDSDILGVCAAHFGIRGWSATVGGASASGQVAILHAIQAVLANQVDACIAVGALMDLSYWECQALRSMGAMGSDRYAQQPARASRPFDAATDGFIFGESCAAVVIEANRRPLEHEPYATVRGWAFVADGQRGPHPSQAGEVFAMRKALEMAQLDVRDIDYVNPHGTGSPTGDAVELAALIECGLEHAYINATKSITGHGLTAAGAVEVVATLLQMEAGYLHPTLNLEAPIRMPMNWVRAAPVAHRIQHALTLSMGFGGINTALCVSRYPAGRHDH